MDQRSELACDRRDFIRALTVAAIVVPAASRPAAGAAAAAQPKGSDGKARYQANSVEVQTFYRVNRYPRK
jgi:hypothetical protein